MPEWKVVMLMQSPFGQSRLVDDTISHSIHTALTRLAELRGVNMVPVWNWRQCGDGSPPGGAVQKYPWTT